MDRKNETKGRYTIPLKIKKYLANVSENANPEDVDRLDPEISAIWKILSAGASQVNYATFFHYILWFEESRKRLDQKLSKVRIFKGDKGYKLVISKEKQKSQHLRAGDWVKLKGHMTDDMYFTARIKKIKNNTVIIKVSRFQEHVLENTYYVDVKFMFPKNLFNMLHVAVDHVHTLKKSYIFSTELYDDTISTPINRRYFNTRIKNDTEQRTAVECIVSGTSGNAPFLLVGPPGTGKTATIAEAVLQLVDANNTNCILVWAHSNKAVDNVACVLQKYKKYFDEPNKLLLRINSKGRKSLNFIRDVVIDEAAQANEPSCLIPVSRMSSLRPLILAGDDKQLGPVVVSSVSKKYGLGLSLMERLRDNNHIYQDINEGKHIVMLKKNYRSDANIIYLPNHLFYGGLLRVMAKVDPLSKTHILNSRKICGAVVFHQVYSTEVKVGPSYCNNDELDIVKLYVVRLIYKYNVKHKDIGIIATYKSQVNIIKEWIDEKKLKIDVETVDAFQGQEKRVILISTVRGKGEAEDVPLGFVTDVKRFNVALTRAKAKAIVIGNPLSLRTSSVWESYIQYCKKLGTCYGDIALEHTKPSVSKKASDTIRHLSSSLNKIKLKYFYQQILSSIIHDIKIVHFILIYFFFIFSY